MVQIQHTILNNVSDQILLFTRKHVHRDGCCKHKPWVYLAFVSVLALGGLTLGWGWLALVLVLHAK